MTPHLQRRLGTFDLAMICIGLVVGSGIFRTPSVVAQRAHVPSLILGCWIAGGAIAMIGAFVFAELAARRPVGGGLYGYLNEAYHPIVGFLFGWTLMLIVGTGANATAAVLFAGYLEPLLGLHANERVVAAGTLIVLACINLLGVRQGTNWQNALSVLKIVALGALVVACFAAKPAAAPAAAPIAFSGSSALVGAFGVAMLPVLFSYNGFQNATFVTSEAVDPTRSVPRGLLLGMSGVIALYVAASFAYLHVLSPSALAASTVPAASAMEAAVGPIGGKLIAVAIALSTLGYLSTCMLAHPRVYYQMAADGLFFRSLKWVNRSNAPAVAIVVQVAIASVIALSGTYEQIVNWVVFPQWLFSALGAGALFVFRRRDAGKAAPFVRVPGHPFTTGLFLLALVGIFTTEFVIYPRDTMYALAVLATGAATFALWQRFARPAQTTAP